MVRDQIFETRMTQPGDFTFDAQVAEVFDDMLMRSVPFYAEQQRMLAELARKFWKPGTRIYDLGCATGTTLLGLAERIGEAGELVGYDNAPPMLERARDKIAGQGLEQRVRVCEGDLSDAAGLKFENASVVTLCWTLQFIAPAQRDHLIRRIYEGMVDGGALLVTEKIVTAADALHDPFVELYYAFKRRNGYSDNEIARKREALENVLIPCSIAENAALFRRCGFETVETFFQWYNFAGFLCVK